MITKDLSVVYIVRPGDHNPELKYSLRTVEKNLPHKDVWLVGYRPNWVNMTTTRHFAVPQTGSILENSFNNIMMACVNPDITEDFVLMHDDMAILSSIDEIGLNNHGYYTTEPRATTETAEGRMKLRNHYYTCNRNTYEFLISRGIKEPINFELHMPMLINKTKFLQLKELVSPDIKELAKYDKISLYGNLHNLQHLGEYKADVKQRNPKDEMPEGPFLSTHDTTFYKVSGGKFVIRNYPYKSRYER